MANIQGQKKWSPIRLLETHELARGGVDGNLNEQAIALANRTEFLMEEKASKSEIVQGVFEFGTYAEFDAVKSTLPANCTVVIGEENTTGSGSWGIGNNAWNGSDLTKSSFDPILAASKDATDKAKLAEKNAIEFIDKQFKQVFIKDFHSENGLSFIVIDQNNNVISAIKNNNLLTANADEFLRDFHTEKFKATYISVDKNLNILNGGSAPTDVLDTSKLQNFAFFPEVLKAGQTYTEFGFLRDQKNWDDDLYKLPVSNFIPNHQSVYAFYDQLVSQNSTRFSMEVIGHDALNNEIRQYTYMPRALISVDDGNSDSAWDAEAIAPPKLVILTGVHGGTEKEAILQLMIFMNEILNRYTEIEEAALLRQARLVIIPCSTPSAIDRGTRVNHAGVDVNRNARDGWSGAGGSPLSQPECALAVDLPNMHPDADCFIDFHNYSSSSMTAWFATHGLGNSLDVIRKVAYELNIMTPARYPFLANRPIRLGRNANGTIARDWQLISNKKGYLIETAIDEGVYPKFELRQHGLTVLRKSLSAIYLSEFGV